jgi:hypothetical protein
MDVSGMLCRVVSLNITHPLANRNIAWRRQQRQLLLLQDHDVDRRGQTRIRTQELRRFLVLSCNKLLVITIILRCKTTSCTCFKIYTHSFHKCEICNKKQTYKSGACSGEHFAAICNSLSAARHVSSIEPHSVLLRLYFWFRTIWVVLFLT